MSAKYGRRDSKKGIVTVRALFFILTIVVALFSMAQTAEAAGTPTQLIVFTDKKVYFDAGINPRATAADGFHPDPSWADN